MNIYVGNLHYGLSEDEIRSRGDTVNVAAMRYYENSNVQAKSYIIPFPSKQFNIEPSSPKGYPCANEYYAASCVLDIDLNNPPAPTLDCGWGSPGSFDGVLTVSTEDLIIWLREFHK